MYWDAKDDTFIQVVFPIRILANLVPSNAILSGAVQQIS